LKPKDQLQNVTNVKHTPN